MLARVALVITAVFVLLCLLCVPTPFIALQLSQNVTDVGLRSLDDGEPLMSFQVTRNPDGSSTGIYLQPNLKLLIRNRGYGPDRDTEVTFNPIHYIFLLIVPPALWFFTHRPSRVTSRRGRLFAYLCAACPVALNVAVLYLRRDDGSPLCFMAWLGVGLVIYLLTQLDRIPSRTARRIDKGLCPNCAYDMRATPRRCPECGYRV